MAHKMFNMFWFAVAALITAGLLAYLLPLLIDKYGPLAGALLSLLIPVAVGLAYVRGYWVCRWLSERREKTESGSR